MLAVIFRDFRGRIKRRLQGKMEFTEFLRWNRLAKPAEGR